MKNNIFSAPDEDIWVGVLRIVISIPLARSKKDKRKVISKLRDRFRSRYNLSIAEVGHLESFSRSVLAICIVNSDSKVLRSQLDMRFQEAIRLLDARIVDQQVNISKFDSNREWVRT